VDELRDWISVEAKAATDENRRAQLFFATQEIQHFEKDPSGPYLTNPVPPPAGDPIGNDGWQ
jgi:hypothetical protein